MRRLITNNQLWLIEIDLKQSIQKTPGIAFLLETRMHQFFARNEQPLKLLHKSVHRIQKKYIVHDEMGDPVYADTKEGEEKKWEFLQSIAGSDGQLITGDDVAKAYDQEVTDFLNRSVNVEI